LHEIVRNLVDNAVKFTESGLVAVTAGPGSTRHTVLIEVTDSGPGISPEDLRTIFDAFEHVGERGRRHAGGVGPGRSVVQQPAAGLGGTVSAASRLGQGSTFRVEIPRVLRPDADGDEAAALPSVLDAVAKNGVLVRERANPLRLLRRRVRR